MNSELRRCLEEGANALKRFKRDEAIACYTRALELDPNCVEARRARAKASELSPHWNVAAADYTWLVERDGADKEALFNRAKAYVMLRRGEDALADYNRLLEMEPDNPTYLHERATTYMFMQRYEESLADFFHAARQEPENGWHIIEIGDVYERQDRIAEALEKFKEGAAIDEKYHCAYEMARLYMKLGLHEEAMKEALADSARRFDWEISENYPDYDYWSLVRISHEADISGGVAQIARLAAAGFYVDVTGVTSEDYDPLPYTIVRPTVIPSERSVLFLEELHEGKTTRRLLRKYAGRLELRFDTDFEEALSACVRIHGEDIITPAFQRCFRAMREPTAGQQLCRPKKPRAVSCSLYIDGRFAAADIAIMAWNFYTSYTGCHTEPNAGSLHLVLLARALRHAGFWVWDFGPCQMAYKTHLGAVSMDHEEFLSIFGSANSVPPEFQGFQGKVEKERQEADEG